MTGTLTHVIPTQPSSKILLCAQDSSGAGKRCGLDRHHHLPLLQPEPIRLQWLPPWRPAETDQQRPAERSVEADDSSGQCGRHGLDGGERGAVKADRGRRHHRCRSEVDWLSASRLQISWSTPLLDQKYSHSGKLTYFLSTVSVAALQMWCMTLRLCEVWWSCCPTSWGVQVPTSSSAPPSGTRRRTAASSSSSVADVIKNCFICGVAECVKWHKKQICN